MLGGRKIPNFHSNNFYFSKDRKSLEGAKIENQWKRPKKKDKQTGGGQKGVLRGGEEYRTPNQEVGSIV